MQQQAGDIAWVFETIPMTRRIAADRVSAEVRLSYPRERFSCEHHPDSGLVDRRTTLVLAGYWEMVQSGPSRILSRVPLSIE